MRGSWGWAWRPAAAFLAAVLATAAAASVVGTQVNLAALTAMGVEVPPGVRARTTAQDLAGFGPFMALIAAAAFLPAFLAAGSATRLLAARLPAARLRPAWRAAAFALAGAAGLWAAFALMGLVTPMPTLVAAARGPAGLAALCATGLLGGLVFARLRARPPAG